MNMLPLPRILDISVLCAAALGVAASRAQGAPDDNETRKESRKLQPFIVRSDTDAISTFVMEGVWSQRTVDIHNRTDTQRSVKLTCPSSDPARGQAEFTRIVNVPARSIRRTRVAIRPGGLAPAPTGKDDASKTGFADQILKLVDAGTGEHLFQSPVPMKQVTPDITVITNVDELDEKGDTYQYLPRMQHADLNDIWMRGSRTINLPDRWYGYSIVTIAMLGGVEMPVLRSSQVEALLDWVRNGGVLVLTGNVLTEEILQGPLGEASGVTIVGVHWIASLEATDPGGKTIGPVEIVNPLPMVEICPQTADVIYTANGLPLLTRHAVGYGTVLTLATPIGALKDPSLQRIWREVSPRRNIVPPVDPSRFAKAGRSALGEIAGSRGPKPAVPVGIVLALAGAMIVAGVVARGRRRGELVWIVFVPLAILTGIGSFVYGELHSRQDERLTFIGLVCGYDGGAVRVQQASAYYSPDEKTMTFSADSTRGVIWDIGAVGSSAFNVDRFASGATQTMPDQIVPNNGTRALLVDAPETADIVTAALTFDQRGLVGELTNHLPVDIETAVLYVARQTYRLGTLRAGQSAKISLPVNDRASKVKFIDDDEFGRVGIGEFTSSNIRAQDSIRNTLIGRIVSAPGGGRRQRVSRSPVLIGYADHSILNPARQADGAAAGWSAIVLPLRIQAPPAGTKVAIPAGFVRTTDAYGSDLRQDPRAAADVFVTAHPPEILGELRDVTLRVEIGVTASNYRLSVCGIRDTPDGQDIASPVEVFDSPAGLLKATITDGDRFRAANGDYKFCLRVQRLGKKDPNGERDIAMWRLRSLDVSIEGITQ